MDYQELSTRIKEKFPQYNDIDDFELATKIVEKYPAYKDTTFPKTVTDPLKPVTGAQIEQNPVTPVFGDAQALEESRMNFELDLDGMDLGGTDFDTTAIDLHYGEVDDVDYSGDQSALIARMEADTGFKSFSDAFTALEGINNLSTVVLPTEAATRALQAGIVEPEGEGFQRKAGFIDTGKALLKSVETLTQALTGSIFDQSQARIEVPGWDSMTGSQQAMYQMNFGMMMPPGVAPPRVGAVVTEEESEAQFELRQKIIEDTKFIPKEWDEAINRVYEDVGADDVPFLELGVKVLASQGATIATGLSPFTGLPAMISVERETMLGELTRAGIPYSDAQDWAGLYGGVSGSIEYIENSGKLVGSLLKKPKEWTRKKAFKMLAGTLKNAGLNVVEELSQDELNRIIFNAAARQYNEKNPNAENPIEERAFSTESMAKTAKTSLAMSVVLGGAGYTRQGIKTVQDVKAVKQGKISVLDNLHLPKEVADQAKADLEKVKTPEEFGAWYDGVVNSVGENGIDGNALIPNDQGYSLADLVNAYIANDPKNAKRNIKQAVEVGGDKVDHLVNSISSFESTWDGKQAKERIKLTDNPYLIQGINELASLDDTSPVIATIDTTVVGLTTPLTQGQFKALGDTRRDLLVAMSMLDTENSQVLVDAVQGNQEAQVIWNDLTKTRKLQEKVLIEGKESLTDNERTQLLEAKKRNIGYKVGADSNARAVEEEVSEKDPSLDPEKGLGLTTRLMSWTNPLKAIARVAPNFANRLSRYESLRNHYYNSYFQNEDMDGNSLRQLQALTKIDVLVRRLMKESDAVRDAMGDFYEADLLELYNGVQDWDSVFMSLAMLSQANKSILDPAFEGFANPELVAGLKEHMDKAYVKRLMKELGVLEISEWKLNNMLELSDTHFRASNDLGRENPDIIVPQIKHDSRNTFLRKKFADDRTAVDDIIQGKRTSGALTDADGNQVRIDAEDLQYLESPFETILRTVKRAADLKAAREILDVEGGLDVRFDQNGLPVISEVSNEALRSVEELDQLNESAFRFVSNTFQDIMSHPVPGGKFVSAWKGTVTPLVSQWSTALKQVGDIPKAFYSVSKIAGWKNTFKIAHDIAKDRISGKVLAGEGTSLMEGWVLDDAEVQLSPSAVGADVIDIDLPTESVAKSFREYYKVVKDELVFAGMEGDTAFERRTNQLKQFWTKSSLLLMKFSDVKMKDIYLEGSVRALLAVDESTRVDRLTKVLRGNTELAVEVSDALVGKTLDNETRTTLYNIMNQLHPLSAFDRAPAFRKLPVFGIFQSFQTMQTAIGQDMVLNPLTESSRYAGVGMQYHARVGVLEKKVADINKELGEVEALERVPKTIGQAEALRDTLRETQRELTSAKSRRLYATQQSGIKLWEMVTGLRNYVTFYLVGDVMISMLIRKIENLLGEEEKPWDEDPATMVLESLMDTAIPIVNLSVLLDERKRANPTQALVSDVTDMPLPLQNTTKQLMKLIQDGEVEDAKKMLKDIPLVGRALYDISLGVEEHVVPNL